MKIMRDRNIDVLVYVKNLMTELERDNFFLLSENPMIEKDIFEDMLIKQCHQNIADFDDPSIDEDQLISIMQETTSLVVSITLNSLYDKGLIDISGMDEAGRCFYKATEIGHKVAEQAQTDLAKKNI